MNAIVNNQVIEILYNKVDANKNSYNYYCINYN